MDISICSAASGHHIDYIVELSDQAYCMAAYNYLAVRRHLENFVSISIFRQLTHAFAFIAAALLGVGSVQATVTAEYVPPFFSSGSSVAGFNNGTTFLPAQTFTTSVGGPLDEISVGIWSGAPNDVSVELRSTSGGLPTSTVLASSVITGSPYASSVLHTADFSSSSVTLDPSTMYAISLRTVNGPPNNVAWSGDFPGSGGGFASSSNNGSSWSLDDGRIGVYRVTILPEPTSIGLLGVIGMIALRRSRKN